MDAHTNKIERDKNGELFLRLPDAVVKDLDVAEGDEVDLIPTALGFEVRKAGKDAPQFWEPFSESVNEYQRALRMIKDADPDKNDDVASK